MSLLTAKSRIRVGASLPVAAFRARRPLNILMLFKSHSSLSESDLFVHRSPDEVPVGPIVTGVQGGVPLTVSVRGGPASNLVFKVSSKIVLTTR